MRGHFSRGALGAAAGLVAGYTAVRAAQAWRDRASPAPARERDARRYGSVRRLLGLLGFARGAASLGVWAYAIAPALEPRLARLPRPLQLPALVALMTLGEAAREWPVDYVEEFVLERVYGTSERGAASWAGDRLKATGLGLALAALLSGLADALMRRAPRRWPWLAVAATPPLLAFANVVVPTFVLPLFNTYTPLEGETADRIRALAGRYGVGHARLLRFDMSRQTKKANAFVTGVFGSERIVLADTLLAEFAPDETLFVVAHELGHYVRRDPWYAIALGTALTGAILLIAAGSQRRAGGHGDGPARSLQLALRMVLGQYAALPLANAFSRAIERRADRFAVEATGDPASGVRAFRKLREQNLAEDEGPRWAELLLASHPSLKSRIAALDAASKSSIV